MAVQPSYIEMFKKGILHERVQILKQFLEECQLCPRRCKVNRLKGQKGYCKAPAELMVSSAFPHFGEEPPLVGKYGSGTIFLTHCNLRCIFCQNYEISHLGYGEKITSKELAEIMLYLQRQGCHNINFVTPTHYVPQILESLIYAIEMGLEIPLIYNCGGYESLEVIKLLEGIFDIYMPDIKFLNPAHSSLFCETPDYPYIVKLIVKEMHRQVGDLKINDEGIAFRGLLIRHLVMPNGMSDTPEVLKFVATEVSIHSYVNIMAQYRPLYRAHDFPPISRRITPKEYIEAIQLAKSLGLYRGFSY